MHLITFKSNYSLRHIMRRMLSYNLVHMVMLSFCNLWIYSCEYLFRSDQYMKTTVKNPQNKWQIATQLLTIPFFPSLIAEGVVSELGDFRAVFKFIVHQHHLELKKKKKKKQLPWSQLLRHSGSWGLQATLRGAVLGNVSSEVKE